MASTPLTPILSAVGLTTTWQTIYTVDAPLTKVGIDAVVFNNYSSTKQDFSVRIVRGVTANSLNEIITEKSIRANSNDLAPAMIGQSISIGDSIEVKSSADDSLSVTITATTFS